MTGDVFALLGLRDEDSLTVGTVRRMMRDAAPAEPVRWVGVERAAEILDTLPLPSFIS
jgi:hypothetical protein